MRKILASNQYRKGGKRIDPRIVPPGPLAQAGVTTIVLDTNVLLVGQGVDGFADDGGVLAALTHPNAAPWHVIVPLVVVTELDGLARSPTNVGRGAKAALGQLIRLLKAHTRLRIQTSRHNYLTDPELRVRTEQVDFAGSKEDGLLAARTLDDVVLRTAIWHDQNPTIFPLVSSSSGSAAQSDPSASSVPPGQGGTAANGFSEQPSDTVGGNVPRSMLVTLDTNLRLKARAYGVAAATPQQMMALLSQEKGLESGAARGGPSSGPG